MSSETHTERFNIAVLGGGSFGTALADICAVNGHVVKQWARSSDQVKEINMQHTNSRYLSGFKIHDAVKAVSDIDDAIENVDLVFVAIPSKSFRSVVRMLKGKMHGKVVVSTAKGIEASTFNLMSQILGQELPDSYVGALSGPNLAREIVDKAITATVIASHDEHVCSMVQKALQCWYFRIYASSDPFGVELGGALKNIYAIASGIASSMGMGENTRSMLITRALAEMSRFAVTMGANPMTFLGLAGVGDLIVTCTSELSRNFRVGQAIGKGASLIEAEASLGQVAEGINTLKLVTQKANEENVYMPIASGLYSVVFEGKAIHEMIQGGMLSQQKNDVEFVSE